MADFTRIFVHLNGNMVFFTKDLLAMPSHRDYVAGHIF